MTNHIETIIRACAVCHQIDRRGMWFDVGEPIYKFIMENYDVSHTYCDDCEVVKKGELALWRKQNAVRKQMSLMQTQSNQTTYRSQDQKDIQM